MKIRELWLKRGIASSEARAVELRCGHDVLARLRIPGRDRADKERIGDLMSEVNDELANLGDVEREVVVAVIDANRKDLAVTTLRTGKPGHGVDVRSERGFTSLALRYAERTQAFAADRERHAAEREETLYRALIAENERLRKRIDTLEERQAEAFKTQEELASMREERAIARLAEEARIQHRGEALKHLTEVKDKIMHKLLTSGKAAANNVAPKVAALLTQIQRVAPAELEAIVSKLDDDGVALLESAMTGLDAAPNGKGKGSAN